MLKLYLDKLLFTAFKVITVFTVILMALLYLYNWDLFHTSDYAMIGLMALKQIETGIHEIYVWSVGYNGILLEVKLIEFFFRLFGANEYTLNFAPLFFLLLFYFVFYKYIQSISSTKTAWLSVFYLTLSHPYFFGRMLRTAPNYPQTLIFGILLFLLVPKIITFFYSKNIGRLLWVYLFLCAFISGFALYTYGQILVFLLAICFYLFLIYLLENLKIHNQNLMRALFYPIQKGSHKIVKVIGGLLCVIGSLHLALGSIFYVFSIQEISLFQFVIKFHGLHLLEAGVKLILVLHLISHSKFIFNSILHSMKVSITLLVGFSMGYLPALVYKWNPMNTASAPVTQIKGSFSDLMGGVSLSVHGFLYWLNLENASYFLFIVLVIFLLFCVFVFYFPYIKKIISAFKEKDTRFLLDIPVIIFLPFVLWFTFFISSMARGEDHFRYLLAIVCFYAFLFAQSTRILINSQMTHFFKFIFIFFFSIQIFLNISHFKYEFQFANNGALWRKIQNTMQAKNLTLGYSDYWIAYYVNLLSNESVKLEPLDVQFSPYYKDLVQSADRIAFIDMGKRQNHLVQNNQVEILGNRYEIESQIQFDSKNATIRQDRAAQKLLLEHGIDFYVLRKVKNELFY